MFGHDNDQDQADDNQSNDNAVITPTPDGDLDAGTHDQSGNDTQTQDNTPTLNGAKEDSSTNATLPSDNNADEDLLSIKQQALQQLSPLVGHLDQTPEEKFKTTMMMIQAADNKTLVKTAYEAAQAITNEKSRAQALLDVINEINYFTQQSDNKD